MTELDRVVAAYPTDTDVACDINDILSETLGLLTNESSNVELDGALRAFGDRVRELDSLQRELARRAAVDALHKDLGVCGAARVVDAALDNGKRETATEKQGRAVLFQDPDLWPDPVDGGDLLDEIVTTILS